MSRESSILPEDLATQSVRLKEEQLRREEEKVEIPLRSYQSHRYLHIIEAPRNRITGSARDKRKETGVVGKRGIASVRQRIGCEV